VGLGLLSVQDTKKKNILQKKTIYNKSWNLENSHIYNLCFAESGNDIHWFNIS
jgi:hypothetical protein